MYQWLFDRQCPSKEEVSISVALSFRNFEFIKFARANGSTVKWMAVDSLDLVQDCAAGRGDLETILWALNQSNEPQMRIRNILIAAATHCHMHILERIERVGSSLGSLRN